MDLRFLRLVIWGEKPISVITNHNNITSPQHSLVVNLGIIHLRTIGRSKILDTDTFSIPDNSGMAARHLLIL